MGRRSPSLALPKYSRVPASADSRSAGSNFGNSRSARVLVGVGRAPLRAWVQAESRWALRPTSSLPAGSRGGRLKGPAFSNRRPACAIAIAVDSDSWPLGCGQSD
jgi:hypothetical protein